MRSILYYRAVCALSLLLCGSALHAAPRVILADGKAITGTSIKADGQGRIFLTTPEAVLTFPAGTTVVVDEPAAFRQAKQLVKKLEYIEAIKLLGEVIRTHRFLTWDRPAERLLATAQLGAGMNEEAILTYERVFERDPTLKDDPEAYNGYLTALQRSGNLEKLLPMLDTAIRSGPRKTAAGAQLMRGKARLEADQQEAAVMDFMRTADLFRDITDAQAEALFHAATTLEEMKDPRASEYFKRLGDEFADSSFAVRAKSRVRKNQPENTE